jgi:hypothetical protein
MGAMQGSGMLRDRDGSVFEGMFDAGKVSIPKRISLALVFLCLHSAWCQKCGWGRTIRPNNDEHIGEYKDGVMDGFGK